MYIENCKTLEGGFNMMEKQDMELISSHKFIKNTSTSGIVHTEHLLNTGRNLRLLEGQDNLHITRQGKRKEREARKEDVESSSLPATVLVDHLLNASRGPETSKRTRERSPCNQIRQEGRKGKGGRKESRTGPELLVGS